MNAPKNKNNFEIGKHQQEVINHFPASKSPLTGKSRLPDFIHAYPIGGVERQTRNLEEMEKLKNQLLHLVPGVFETYSHDITLLQKKKPEATLLDVTYDKDSDRLSAPSIYHRERFSSRPEGSFGHGSIGRAMASAGLVEYDIVSTIDRKLINIGSDGKPEYLYVAELVQQNHNVLHDEYDNWRRSDGSILIQIAVDPTYEQVFAELRGGPVDTPIPLRGAIEALKKAFPV